MQEIKPKKDELLNQILQEIADENNAINNSFPEKNIPSNTKRFSSEKKIENIVIAILVILIIFVLFYNLDQTDAVDHNDTSEVKSSISKADQPKVQKKVFPKTEQKETLDKEVKSKKTVQLIVTQETKSNAKVKKVLELDEPKTEREKAKESLLKQMQH